MSHSVNVSPEARAKDAAFLQERAASGKEKYIVRHSKQARLTHGITVIACILLAISGLFVFVPQLAQAVGADTVFVIRMPHRVLGFIFVLVPLISAIMAPKGVAHIFKNLFAKWSSDDKKWMLLFFPYLFMAKWIHMPDQERLRFFRTLWGVQAEVQKEHAGKVGRALTGMPISRIRFTVRSAGARRPWRTSAKPARRPRAAAVRCGVRSAVASGISSACVALAGDDDHRIATCDECGGYVRTVYQEDGPMAQLYPFSYEVEDVVMAKLDLITYRQLVAQEAQQD